MANDNLDNSNAGLNLLDGLWGRSAGATVFLVKRLGKRPYGAKLMSLARDT